MQGTQYATKRSILCRGAFCGPTGHVEQDILSKNVPIRLKNVDWDVQHQPKPTNKMLILKGFSI